MYTVFRILGVRNRYLSDVSELWGWRDCRVENCHSRGWREPGEIWNYHEHNTDLLTKTLRRFLSCTRPLTEAGKSTIELFNLATVETCGSN